MEIDDVPALAENINKALAVFKELIEKVASLQPF